MVGKKQERGQDVRKPNNVDPRAELKELRDMVIEQKTELSNKIEKLEEEKSELISRVKVLDARVSTSESEVKELKRQITESPKVAFSLGLTDAGTIGPFPTWITLKFSRVLTNSGQAYSTDTGVFTAPFRGVYFFRFTGYVLSNNQAIALALYHNDRRVSWNFDFSDTSYESVSNGFVLELEKGDAVYLVLPAGHTIFDDPHNRTVFSGFLIFPL